MGHSHMFLGPLDTEGNTGPPQSAGETFSKNLFFFLLGKELKENWPGGKK